MKFTSRMSILRNGNVACLCCYFPKCHMFNLRKGYVPCHCFFTLQRACYLLSPMSHVACQFLEMAMLHISVAISPTVACQNSENAMPMSLYLYPLWYAIKPYVACHIKWPSRITLLRNGNVACLCCYIPQCRMSNSRKG